MCDKVVNPAKLENTGYDIFRKEELENVLRLGTRYMPYAEKHKIYELFQEIISAMLLELPEDHIIFIQDYLEQASYNRDTSRVFVYGPPYYDVEKFVYKLAEITGSKVIRRSDAKNYETNEPIRNPKKFAQRVKDLLEEQDPVENPCTNNNIPLHKQGWIFFEMPMSRAECVEFMNLGIDPTHVLYIITCVVPPYKRLSFHDIPMDWKVWKHHMVAIKDVYRDKITEVNVGNRGISALATDCAQVIRVKKSAGVLMLPRVAIIGNRGSGRKTQAKMLAQRMNLVYIDFEDLINTEKIRETKLRYEIQNWSNHKEYSSDLLIRILEKRIYEDDCLNRGWVVVGFPNTVEDILAMDQTDTPPGRIIYLQVPNSICRDRILKRRVDQITGKTYHLDSVFPLTKEQKENLAIHPRDRELYVNTEIEYYSKHVDKMKAYTKETATCIDGVGRQEDIFKHVEAVIIRPVLPVPPRNPYIYHKSEVAPAPKENNQAKMNASIEFVKGSVNLDDYNISMSTDSLNQLHSNMLKSAISVHNLLAEQNISNVGSTYSKPDAAAIMADGSKPEIMVTTYTPDYSNSSYLAKTPPSKKEQPPQLSPISEKDES